MSAPNRPARSNGNERIMAEESPRGFRIDFSEEAPARPVEQPRTPRKKTKKEQPRPGRAGRILSFLAFCVLAGLLAAGYHDLHSRMRKLESAQSFELEGLTEKLSARIDKRLDAISKLVSEPTQQIKARILELEKLAENNAAAIEELRKTVSGAKQATGKNIADVRAELSGRIEELESEVGRLRSTLGKELEAAGGKINRLEKSIDPLRAMDENIGKLSETVKGLDSRINAMDKQLGELRAELGKGVDPQELENRLRELEKTIRRRIEDQAQPLGQRISEVEDEIQALGAIIRSLENAQPPGKTGETGSSTAPSPTSSGKIIEQEIK